MIKYPRTRHIEGSRLQPGDEDLDAVAFSELRERPLVVEEKVDGANAAVSFGEDGRLLLQSRGHYLRGGAGAALRPVQDLGESASGCVVRLPAGPLRDVR